MLIPNFEETKCISPFDRDYSIDEIIEDKGFEFYDKVDKCDDCGLCWMSEEEMD